MKVADIMTTQVGTCHTTDRLDQAVRIMWEWDCGSVPVLDRESRVVGMITDRDACMAAFTQGRALQEILVSRAMSQALYSCRPDDGLDKAQELMRGHKVRRLPVTDWQGHLAGVVSITDLAREAAREKQEKAVMTQVKFDEIGETLAAITEPHPRTGARPAVATVAS